MGLVSGTMRRIEREGIDGPVVPDEGEDTMDSATLQSILSSSDDLIIVQDADGRILHASDSFARMEGASSKDLVGRRLSDIDKHGEMTPVEAIRKEVLRTGESPRTEILTQSGRCLSLTILPLAGEHGAIRGTVATARDITWQKELEKLRDEEHILRSAVEPVRDLVYVKDLEGRYIMANASLREGKGKDLGQVLGRSDLELMGDNMSTLDIIENDRKVMRSGKGEMFEERVPSDSGALTFLSDKTPTRDGEGRITGIIGISRDITERKRMEEIEKARSRWLESIMECAPVAIGVSRDGNTIYANSPYLRLFGYSRLEEVKGRPFIEQVVPEDQAKALAHAERHSGTGSAEPEIELMGRRRDGTRFPFRVAVTCAELPDGPALLGFFTDMTERRRLEKGLEESRYTTELYIDILTHDISNYNAAAIGYLQLMDMHLEPDEKGHGFVLRSLQALADSSELIANIRDLQNIEADRDRPELIDVCTMLDEIKGAYRNPPDREVSISLTVHGICTVYASRLLRGAFSNLISNAIKHSSGAVDIQITVSNQHRNGVEMVRVDVSDNGPGIPHERKESIFDRSLMGLTKPVSRGLGLYLVKRLVETYGGEIWVEDRIPGDHTQGARFVVLLPRAGSGGASLMAPLRYERSVTPVPSRRDP